MKINHITLTLIIWFVLIHFDCASQSQKIVKYKAIIVSTVGNQPVKGFIKMVSDSSLEVVSGNENIQIHANQIDYIRIRRFHNVGRCAAIGGGIGAGSGVILGAISGDDNSSNTFAMTGGEKALIGGVVLGLIGTGVGGFIGFLDKERIKINHDANNLKNVKDNSKSIFFNTQIETLADMSYCQLRIV